MWKQLGSVCKLVKTGWYQAPSVHTGGKRLVQVQRPPNSGSEISVGSTTLQAWTCGGSNATSTSRTIARESGAPI